MPAGNWSAKLRWDRDWLVRQWLVLALCYAAAWILPYALNVLNFMLIALIQQITPELQVGTVSEAGGSPSSGSVTIAVPLTWCLVSERLLHALVLYAVVTPVIVFVRKKAPAFSVEPPSGGEQAKNVIIKLRLRSALLKLSAAFCLVLIVGSLLLGILIFVAADRIASVEPAVPAKTQPASPPQSTFIISTLSTRIGAVLILVFLVRVLVTMYRYNIRLATYYDGRGDALQVFGLNLGELKKFVAFASPESVEFDTAPKSPLQEAASGLGSALEGTAKVVTAAKSALKEE
jgi:hypothetical protein